MINILRPTWYLIDWDRAQTLDDVKFILSKLELGISDRHTQFEQLKPFLRINPVPPDEEARRGRLVERPASEEEVEAR